MLEMDQRFGLVEGDGGGVCKDIVPT
jgi:hypothetical protein